MFTYMRLLATRVAIGSGLCSVVPGTQACHDRKFIRIGITPTTVVFLFRERYFPVSSHSKFCSAVYTALVFVVGLCCRQRV